MDLRIASPATALTIIAVASMVIYFFLFFRLVTRYPQDSALMNGDKKARFGNLILGPTVLAAYLAPAPYNVIAFCAAIVLLPTLARAQHKRLAKLGAEVNFLKKLIAISMIAYVGILAYGVAMLMSTRN